MRVRVRSRVCTSHSSHAPMPSLGWTVPGPHLVWLGLGFGLGLGLGLVLGQGLGLVRLTVTLA